MTKRRLVAAAGRDYTPTTVLKPATFLCSALVLAALSGCKVNNVSIHTITTPPATGGATTAVVVTPSDKPTAVPAAARPVAQTTKLGAITRQAGPTPQVRDLRRLIDASCADGLLTISTSKETIYATLPCDRFWDEKSKQQFVSKEAAITLEISARRQRILIETLDGAQAEFTVEGIWVG